VVLKTGLVFPVLPELNVDDGFFALEDGRVVGFSGMTKGIANRRLVACTGEGHDDK
jgi:hypothetical protein